jgi:organic radical activating enzyme
MSHNLKTNSLEKLKEPGYPVVVVAAVPEGEIIANICRESGINIVGFCDNIKEKSLRDYCGYKVFHTPELPLVFPNARFIIVSQHIQDCVEQLTSLGYDDFYSPLDFLKIEGIETKSKKVLSSYLKSRIEVCKKSHEMYLSGKNKVYLRSIDIMVTTRCSLKCESCSNLMQYYTNPKNTEAKNILESIDIISKNVDEIAEFRIIGGEPLMNKSWDEIVLGISDNHPNKEIFIYTNGTIAPKDEKLEKIKKRKVNFIITEYGHLSRNLNKLQDGLKRFNLNYLTSPAEHWVDCSSIRHHKRSIEDLKLVFKQCCVKYIYTLLDGKLYRCPFIANAANLSAIPDNPSNYIDLFSKTKDIKNEIRKLVNVAKFFPGCDFCDGRPYDGTSKIGYDGKGMIKAGIQTKKILPYKSYN